MGTSGGIGIRVGSGSSNVVIRHVVVKDWWSGVENAVACTIESSIIRDNGNGVMVDGNGGTITTSLISSNSHGIAIAGGSAEVFGNWILNNGWGIYHGEPGRSIIHNNHINRNSIGGIYIASFDNPGSADIYQNEISNNGYGIQGGWSNIYGNTLNANSVGMRIWQDYQIYSNVVTNSLDTGLAFTLNSVEYGYSGNNEIYNNYLVNKNNAEFSIVTTPNSWNVAYTPGDNIVGGGPFWEGISGDPRMEKAIRRSVKIRIKMESVMNHMF